MGCFCCRWFQACHRGDSRTTLIDPHVRPVDPSFDNSREPPPAGVRLNSSVRSYTVDELRQATKEFAVKLGEGGFGPVYKGLIIVPPNTRQWIAVKKLSSSSGQGLSELVKEIEVLPRLHHRHLVRLLGYCDDDSCYALVYEFIPNGTLRDHLRSKKPEDFLPWSRRLAIALDVANAISYLHIHVAPAVIHRDIKSANVLLDEKLRAKLADFGLSKLLTTDEEYTHITTAVKGTAGYVDPEYHSTRRLTDKSDVYSFGVLLLELLSGRQPMEFLTRRIPLVNWSRSELQKGDLRTVLDGKILDGTYSDDAAWKLAGCAMRCCEPYSYNRPAIGEVTRLLQEAKAAQDASDAANNRPGEMQRPVYNPTTARPAGGEEDPRGQRRAR